MLDDLVLIWLEHLRIREEVHVTSPIAYHHWEVLILCLGIVLCTGHTTPHLPQAKDQHMIETMVMMVMCLDVGPGQRPKICYALQAIAGILLLDDIK